MLGAPSPALPIRLLGTEGLGPSVEWGRLRQESHSAPTSRWLCKGLGLAPHPMQPVHNPCATGKVEDL